ncbi:MAG: glycoside hydrolase family 31 protein [Kofleriaceae bacterium]
MKLLVVALLIGCSDPPPPTVIAVGDYTARVFSDPAHIEVAQGDTIVWQTESGGGDGKPPHGFGSVSTKSYTLMQEFGSYRFDENADQTVWQPIDKLGGVTATASGATFDLQSGDGKLGSGTLALDGGHITLTLTSTVGDSISLGQPLIDAEHIVGLGGQSFDVDQRGQHVPLWVQEDGIGKAPDPDDQYTGIWFLTGRRHSTHTPMPMFLSSANYALAVDTNARTVFDLGFEKSDSARYEAWDHTLAVHVWVGAEPLNQMLEWVGKPDVPPATVFSPWVDAIYGSASVRQVAQALRDNGISSSVIWTEDWRGGADSATGYALKENWRVDRTLYPDIETLASDLHSEGFQFLVYHNTFIDNTADVFAEATAGGYPIQKDGATYEFTGITFGDSTLLDLTNPASRTWATSVMGEALTLGADGWMADFGEWLPTDATLASGEDALHVHNRYPVEWAKFNHDLLTGDKLYFMRSAWLHSQPLAQVIWPGDQQTDWSDGDGLPSVIPMGIGLGITGFPYFGGDIGGYMSQGTTPTTEELWYRWVELGAFEPVMRTHHGRSARDNFQWQHDANSIAHFKRYARFHQQLALYLQGSIASFQQHGRSLLRLIALEFPDEDWAWSVLDEFMLGDRILVAPVQAQGAVSRDLQLPAGEWIPLFGGAHVQGGPGTAQAAVTEIPAYVPAGSLLVLYPDGIDTVVASPALPTATHPSTAREVWLYPGTASDPARSTWHEVAGPTSTAPEYAWSGRPAGAPTSAAFGGTAVPVTDQGAFSTLTVTGNGQLAFGDGGMLTIARGTPGETIVRLYH